MSGVGFVGYFEAANCLGCSNSKVSYLGVGLMFVNCLYKIPHMVLKEVVQFLLNKKKI